MPPARFDYIVAHKKAALNSGSKKNRQHSLTPSITRPIALDTHFIE